MPTPDQTRSTVTYYDHEGDGFLTESIVGNPFAHDPFDESDITAPVIVKVGPSATDGVKALTLEAMALLFPGREHAIVPAAAMEVCVHGGGVRDWWYRIRALEGRMESFDCPVLGRRVEIEWMHGTPWRPNAPVAVYIGEEIPSFSESQLQAIGDALTRKFGLAPGHFIAVCPFDIRLATCDELLSRPAPKRRPAKKGRRG